MVTSRHLNQLKRDPEIDSVPPSFPASAFCNITGAPLGDESRSLVQIIRNRTVETRLIFLLGPFVALPTGLDTAQNFLTMASSLQPHFDRYAFGIDVDDNYKIVQFAPPSPEFDLSDAGTLKIPEGQKMPYDECLRLHFNFCLQIYVSSPPPGVQTHELEDIEDLQEEVGMYERDESLPDLTDPIWSSPLGREVLRAAKASRLSR
ncbi:hypothetical protein BS47DRAFT_30643 [Hydnum rufescens UP504]|uniref:HNH nuclease domain-containing protein n=1 Tax=Hydnum rufescens UP504 TaxID=1448309 RepID=A0A9P6E1J3_9AGAM|nr:hypothetical protein BS47DRAFT_30643 [Hydnum rufescens UP504]